MQEPEGRLEAPWEVTIRKIRMGYIVAWYVELNDAPETLYRLVETKCNTIEEAYGCAAEHFDEMNTCAYRYSDDE